NSIPIRHQGEIIGAISIVYLSQSNSKLIYSHLKETGLLEGFVYLLCIVIAVFLLIKIKRTFLSLEPEE
ncbi:sensor histidine kinase, partial [Marinomonas arenicola]